MSDFKLDDFTQRSVRLLERTRAIFERYSDRIDKKIELPSTMQPADGPIKLVFIGQYSSGKSSIIKMLSGIDTKIGAAITTDEPQSYPWGELEIVDTPGIHTGIRADHDVKSYNEIDRAALLVFVVTNEGFDDYIGKHFQKLAIDQKRARNMVLVVNKMDRMALGNTPESQQVLAGDIREVIKPHSTEDVYLSFVSTEMYFKSLTATDERRRKRYFERSGYEQFVKNLNAFVASRGVLSKVQTPLEGLRSAILKVDKSMKKSSIGADRERVEDSYRQSKRAIDDGKLQLKFDLERLAEACANKIRAEGSRAASNIEPGISDEQYKGFINSAQSSADQYVRDCEQEMSTRLDEVFSGIDRELEHSSLKIDVQRELGISSEHAPSTELDGITIGTELKSNLSMLGMKSKAASALGVENVPLFGGELKATSVVKGVGHLFGVKFAPWGAANIVKTAAETLGAIGMAYQVYHIGKKLFGEDEEKKLRDQFRAVQEDVRNQFNAAANSARSQMIAAAMAEVNRIAASKLKAEKIPLDALNREIDRNKELALELEPILADVDALMEEVQRTARA